MTVACTLPPKHYCVVIGYPIVPHIAHPPHCPPPQALVPGFHAAITTYMQAVTAVGMRLLRLLALGLGLVPSWFDSRFDQPMLFLRPLHYDATVSHPSDVWGVL